MSTRRRIIQGVGANGFGHLVTIVVQLASVPILMHAWGTERYGEWVTISAIPSYLALSDVGLSLVAGNALALMADKGDVQKMQVIYQSTWAMVSALSLFALLVAMAVLLTISPGAALGVTSLSESSLNWTLLFLFAYMAFSMQSGILQLPFKAVKKNPQAVAYVNLIRLGEWVAGTIVAVSGGGLTAVALTFMLFRLIGNIVFGIAVSRRQSVLRLGVANARMEAVRALLKPSLASMAFPLGLALTVQGFVLLVGATMGAVGVAVYSVYRTFTRIPIQLATAVNRAVWPELSYAVGGARLAKARGLVRRMLLLGALLSVLSFAFVRAWGIEGIDFWVRRVFPHNKVLLAWLALAASVHILWQPYWVALMATNLHTRFALAFAVISAVSLICGWMLIKHFGLSGVGGAAALGEALLAISAFHYYRTKFRGLAGV